MSKILFVIEFGGFGLPLDQLAQQGHEIELAKNMRKALPLLKKIQPELLIAEFIYTSQFRDRDSNLDTILTQIQSQSPHTKVIAFVEKEQETHFDRLSKRFPEIKAGLFFPFEPEALQRLIKDTLD